MNEETIYELLKKSRKRTKVGDISVFRVINTEEYFYIRTISTTAKSGMGDFEALLLYFYNAKSKVKEEIPYLDKYNLLIPPIMTNYLGWVRGYFEVIKNIPLKENDVLPVHCFKDPRKESVYWDDKGNNLINKTEPWGWYGLSSYRSIENRIRPIFGFKEIKGK